MSIGSEQLNTNDMEDEYQPPQKMKTIAMDMGRFSIAEQKKFEYENYVTLTAKMLGVEYISVHRMVIKWPMEKIIRHYELSTKHNGTMPSDVYWWWLRKKERAKV